MAQFLSSFKAISVPAIRCNGCNRRQETIQSSVSKLGLYFWNSFEPFQLFKRQQCLTQPVFGPYQSPFRSVRRTVEWRRQLAEEVAEGMYSVASMDTPNPQFHMNRIVGHLESSGSLLISGGFQIFSQFLNSIYIGQYIGFLDLYRILEFFCMQLVQ